MKKVEKVLNIVAKTMYGAAKKAANIPSLGGMCQPKVPASLLEQEK
jgi:cyclic lactone autoinducer peptide